MTPGPDAPAAPVRLSRRKRVVFALAAAAIALGVTTGALVAADVRVHHRLERSAGVNVWGYRGPTLPRKARGEHRLVVLGGSTAFGYGVSWNEAFPAQLETDLRALSKNGAPVRVVNLGFNSQGAYAFVYNLADYASLDYDAALLYEGYNDLEAPNEFVGRRESVVFRMFGYYPLLDTALQEKALALRSGGDLNAAYAGRTVFRPGLAARTTAAGLETAARIGDSLHAQLERFQAHRPTDYRDVRVEEVGCAGDWRHYCASMDRAIRFLLAHGKTALVVTQPYLRDRHREQQAQLRAMLAARYGGNPRVGYANLGELIDLAHSPLAYDTMHLTREGNGVVAGALVAPVAALMPDAFDAPSSARGGPE
jgi:hypothetical protein